MKPYDPNDPRFLAYLAAWKLELENRVPELDLEIYDMRGDLEHREMELDALREQIETFSTPSEAAWAEYLDYWYMPAATA